MARGRFFLPIIGLFVVLSLIFAVGNNRREEQDAWMQGYMAGQMSVQSQGEGGTVINPAAYAMYGQNFRGGRGGPGFFGFIPLLILGFIAFKVIRGGWFRRWQQAGGPNAWGNDRFNNEFDGRGPWGRGHGPWNRGHHGGQAETPTQERPAPNRPMDDDVI
jgi:hypothetical protein